MSQAPVAPSRVAAFTTAIRALHGSRAEAFAATRSGQLRKSGDLDGANLLRQVAFRLALASDARVGALVEAL